MPPSLLSFSLFQSEERAWYAPKKIVSTTPSAVRCQSFVAGCELLLSSDFITFNN